MIRCLKRFTLSGPVMPWKATFLAALRLAELIRTGSICAGTVCTLSFQIGLVVILVLSSGVSAQVRFTEVSEEIGLGRYRDFNRGHGSGVAAADFDRDGFVDMFVPGPGDTRHFLYRNLGDGTFEEVAEAYGLVADRTARAGLWFDYDGDGRLDLVLTSDCYQRDCGETPAFLQLYRQDGAGMFADVTASAGLDEPNLSNEKHSGGLAAGDLDGDGDLDLVTTVWEGRLRLFRNNGDGTFSDVSVASGLLPLILGHWQPVLLDFDGDGRMDIYSSVDFTENRLLLNTATQTGQLAFADMAGSTGCDNAMNDMGVAIGDVDGDGDPDLYVTNIRRPERELFNVLLRNDSTPGSPKCAEISEEAGVRDGGWGWGATFLDVDRDGDLDLAETNGWRFLQWRQPPKFFLNSGGTFVDIAEEAGLVDIGWASSILAFDGDRDGDLDLVQNLQEGEVSFYRNELVEDGDTSHYLIVRPRMSGPNVYAIGTRISLESNGQSMTRWITAGTSFLGQEPAEAFFGLAEETVVDRLVVTWPDGSQSERLNVAVDQVLDVSPSTQSPCVAGVGSLCLAQGRFDVTVNYRDFQGGQGSGRAAPLTGDSGTFWFFDPANVELIVKVLDASAINGHFWVFFGSLTNVEYSLTIRDTETGLVKTYVNPEGQFASLGDTSAFPSDSSKGRFRGSPALASRSGAVGVSAPLPTGSAPAPFDMATEPRRVAGNREKKTATRVCAAGATTLCLNQGRFRVSVEWMDFEGGSGVGQATQLTPDTGGFWFFDAANVELVLKVLDARSVNGRFWVFYGALSNVEYRLTVEDTTTGEIVIYSNPLGEFGSVGDTEAF